MEWPASVTTSALFADFPQTVFNLSGQPAWELLNPDHPSGIKQILSKKLKQLGSKHPTDVLYVTIDEAKGPVHVEEGATIVAGCCRTRPSHIEEIIKTLNT